MKINAITKGPEIRTYVGVAVPGYGLVVGGGLSSKVILTEEVDRAAQLLREAFGMDVDIRFNSSGRSGGAYLVTDRESRGIGSNSSIGISVGLAEGECLRFHANVSAKHLRDETLATHGMRDGLFGLYAYHAVSSVDEALAWIMVNVNKPQQIGC